jgi:hypothetical protein
MQRGVANTRRAIPAGLHVLAVVTAEYQRVPWRRSPTNPAGDVLAMRLVLDDAHQLIHCDLPTDKPRLLAIAAASFGIAPANMQPGQLEGRKAAVEVEHVRTRRGIAKAVVRAWVPATAAAGRRKA